MTTTTNPATLIAEHFTRNDHGATTLTDDAPAWLCDACRDAHDDEWPNDWRWELCERIVDDLAEYDPDNWGDAAWEIADRFVDIYNADLAQWLADNPTRAEYVNEWHTDLGSEFDDVFSSIRGGQYVAIERMVSTLATAIADNT